MALSRRSIAAACAALLLFSLWTLYAMDLEWYRATLLSSSTVVLDIERCNQDFEAPIHEDVVPAEVSASAEPSEVDALAIRRTHIAVASFFSFHFDVYMALVWTLERVLSQVPGSQLRVFAQPFYYGFQSIVDDFDLYHGEQRSPEELLEYARSNPTLDMIVLGTCEIDLPQLHSELLAEWDSRSTAEKFQLVCIVHNVIDLRWQDRIQEWSRRGALRLLPLGEHVKDAFRAKFDALAESQEPLINSASFEHIPIDVHVPVLDVKGLPVKDPNRKLSKAVIQGSFDTSRRNYTAFFSDIIQSLHDDPEAWGYHPLGNRPSFVPKYKSADPPFELALVGSGQLQVPEELAYMVTLYRGLDYADFYKLVANMDIVVPAFADNGYYEHQASSTVALAVELDVPILATRRMRKAYKYIDDDRVVVTRPSTMREVQALKALRTGEAGWFLDEDPNGDGIRLSSVNRLVNDVHEMLSRGWTRVRAEVRQFKEALWKENDAVALRLLKDD